MRLLASKGLRDSHSTWTTFWGAGQAELDQVCNEVDRRLQYACLYGNGPAMRTYSPIAYRLAEIRRQMLNHPLTGQGDPMMFRDEIREIRNSLKH